MPKNKTVEKVSASSVSTARRKAPVLAASKSATPVKAAASKPRAASTTKKKAISAATGDLLVLADSVANSGANGHVTTEQIAQRAYFLWLERGCPQGTADQDWMDAELQLGVHA